MALSDRYLKVSCTGLKSAHSNTVEPRFSVSKYSVKPRISVIFLNTKTKTINMKQI